MSPFIRSLADQLSRLCSLDSEPTPAEVRRIEGLTRILCREGEHEVVFHCTAGDFQEWADALDMAREALAEADSPFCPICDALDHGYPGAGRCPIEDRCIA